MATTALALLAPYEIFGVRLVAINAESGHKLLLSLTLIAVVYVMTKVLRGLVRMVIPSDRFMRIRFWIRQAISLLSAVTIFIGLISLWFDDPTRLATGLGLVTAGLAFALQKVVTALAGYVVIMRGKTFEVGDRIVMGGVRGDVVGLTFTQTSIMEMGQPPAVQNADPAMWVRSRQFTGRLVAVSNARVFDEPIYNYTREFPYIWEEIAIPISYSADRDYVEKLLLESADRHTKDLQKLSKEDLEEMRRRYQVPDPEVKPKVFYRLTDNWLELTVRFLAPDHGIRELKDQISRDILRGLEARGIEIASATFEITGIPALKLDVMQPQARRDGRENGRHS